MIYQKNAIKANEIVSESEIGLLFKSLVKYQSFLLRIHWRLLTILKTNKKLYEVMFFDM